jgi:hypothetical protein
LMVGVGVGAARNVKDAEPVVRPTVESNNLRLAARCSVPPLDRSGVGAK